MQCCNDAKSLQSSRELYSGPISDSLGHLPINRFGVPHQELRPCCLNSYIGAHRDLLLTCLHFRGVAGRVRRKFRKVDTSSFEFNSPGTGSVRYRIDPRFFFLIGSLHPVSVALSPSSSEFVVLASSQVASRENQCIGQYMKSIRGDAIWCIPSLTPHQPQPALNGSNTQVQVANLRGCRPPAQ